MILTAFRCDRFGFLPELFAVDCRLFYLYLSTGKDAIALYAPHRSVVVAFIRLVRMQLVIAPAVDQLCLDWESPSPFSRPFEPNSAI
jgi:hypothetical protein